MLPNSLVSIPGLSCYLTLMSHPSNILLPGPYVPTPGLSYDLTLLFSSKDYRVTELFNSHPRIILLPDSHSISNLQKLLNDLRARIQQCNSIIYQSQQQYIMHIKYRYLHIYIYVVYIYSLSNFIFCCFNCSQLKISTKRLG